MLRLAALFEQHYLELLRLVHLKSPSGSERLDMHACADVEPENSLVLREGPMLVPRKANGYGG